MNLFKSLFQNNISENYDDYSKLYFRWEREGKEYGPLDFEDMLTRNWSNRPIEGRFENEQKWRDYSFFEKILNRLKISKEQISEMKKLGIESIDTNTSFIESVSIISSKREEIRKQRKQDREEKDKLPATKQSLKKLKDLGIDHPENITQGEAKSIIANYIDNEKDQERLIEIIKYFNSINFSIFNHLSIESIINEDDTTLPTLDQFEELYSSIKELLENQIKINFPKSLNRDEMDKFNNDLADAEFEAEDIEDQLKDRAIILGNDEFKVVGKLPKNQLLKIRTEIINRYLAGDWDQDKDLKEIILKHLPDLSFKEIDY